MGGPKQILRTGQDPPPLTVSLTVKYPFFYDFSQQQKTRTAEPEILSTRAFETKVKSFITSQETLHKEHYNGNDVHI